MISRLIVIVLFDILTSYFVLTQISTTKDYISSNGIQVYLYEDSSYYIYLSIDSESSLTLKMTIYLYTTKTVEDITSSSNGIYLGIGFGSTAMADSDIIICGVTKNKTGFCDDYNARGWSIVQKTINITNLKEFKSESLDQVWAPYKNLCTFKVERKPDPLDTNSKFDVSKIIKGQEDMVACLGEILSGKIPKKHTKTMYTYKTKDGTTKDSKLIEIPHLLTLNQSSLTSNALVKITNLKKKNSIQALEMSIGVLALILFTLFG